MFCDMSRDEVSLKVILVTFCDDIDFVDEIVPSEDKALKRKKCHLETWLLVEATTKEER